MYFFHDTAYPGRTQAIIARLTLTAVSLLHKGPLHTVQGKQYEQPFSTEPLSLSLSPSPFQIQAIKYTFDPIPPSKFERKSFSSIFNLGSFPKEGERSFIFRNYERKLH